MSTNDSQQNGSAPAEQKTPVLDPQQAQERPSPDPGGNTPENGSEARKPPLRTMPSSATASRRPATGASWAMSRPNRTS